MIEQATQPSLLREFLRANPSYRVYDFSQLESYDTCPRKYNYTYNEQLQRGTSIEAEFSSKLIHPSLALWYAGQELTEAHWQTAWAAFTEHEYIGLTKKQSQVFTLSVAQQVVAAFAKRYASHRDEYDFVCTEKLSWKALPGAADAIWLSKPDIVVQRKDNAQPIPVEIKCSTWNINEALNPLDRQLHSQAWTLDAEQQLRVFIHLETTSKSEFKQVNASCQVQQIDTDLLDEWLSETAFSVRAIQQARLENVWPKRAPRACKDFNRQCEFYGVCVLGKQRGMALASLPRQRALGYLGL